MTDRKTIKTKTWIIIIGLLIVFSCIAILYNSLFETTGTIAYIYQNGVCIRSIDLSKAQNESFVITDKNGSNTILIEDGKICISEADCPDQVCVKHSWLKNSLNPIVCLPHKLVIAFISEDNDSNNNSNELDGVVQ